MGKSSSVPGPFLQPESPLGSPWNLIARPRIDSPADESSLRMQSFGTVQAGAVTSSRSGHRVQTPASVTRQGCSGPSSTQSRGRFACWPALVTGLDVKAQRPRSTTVAKPPTRSAHCFAPSGHRGWQAWACFEHPRDLSGSREFGRWR